MLKSSISDAQFTLVAKVVVLGEGEITKNMTIFGSVCLHLECVFVNNYNTKISLSVLINVCTQKQSKKINILKIIKK